MKYKWENDRDYFARIRSGGYEHTYEKIIHFLMHNDYAQNVDVVSKAFNIRRETLVHVHVKKCQYLIYNKKHDLISFNRSGKGLHDLGVEIDFPDDNTSIFNFVCALYARNDKLTFRESIPLVQSFCQSRGLDIGRYAFDQNTVFEQCKKTVRKFRKDVII